MSLTTTIFTKIGQNTLILLLVNLAGALLGFLLAAALGRGLGDIGFGQYSLVMTWLLTLMLLGEFGLSTVLTRDLAAQPEQTRLYLTNSIAAKIGLGAPLLLILLVFAPQLAANTNPDVTAGLRWGAIFLCGGLIYSSFTAIFRAHQTMLPILWLTLGGQLILLTGTIGLLWANQPISLLIAWAGLSQLAQIGLAILFYRRLTRLSPADFFTPARLNGQVIKNLLERAWPFALAGFLAAFQLRANALLLAYLAGEQSLGWYAAANRFIETGRQLPAAFYAAALPALAALAGGENAPARSAALSQTLQRSRLGLLVYSLLAATGALLLAGPILELTYGPTFLPAAPTLQILALSLIPSSQNSLLIIYLYACGDEKFVNKLLAGGTLVNLGLCLWLIPLWGAAGTALALLIAESALYMPYRFRAAKHQF